LDDYHAIETPAIHDAVAVLQEHLPPRVHPVIAGRVDAPLPHARLRARGPLAEIRAADLRFTPDEAVAFYREVMGLDLTARRGEHATLQTHLKSIYGTLGAHTRTEAVARARALALL
jgi:LuxR family maltose regulon positive regulatory protein